MALLETVHQTMQLRRSSPRFSASFSCWRTVHGGLRPFASIEDFIAGLGHEPSSSPTTDAALGALCAQAARGGKGGACDDDAACLLLWILLAPLTRRSRDPDVATALGADDVQAEIAAGLWEAVVAIGPSDINVAARLINAGRRRVRAAARTEIDRRLRRSPLFEVADADKARVEARPPEWMLGLAARRGVITEFERELIAVTRLGPEPVARVAARTGLTFKAACHRRARAEARVRAWIVGRPIPSRFSARGRAVSVTAAADVDLSDLWGNSGPALQDIDRKEVMPGPSGGVLNHPPHGSDEARPPGAPAAADAFS